MLNSNKARMGESVYIIHNSIIMFNDDPLITIVNNNAVAGGGIIAEDKPGIHFGKKILQ